METPVDTQPRRENALVNFAFNLILPVLLLTKGADWFGLDPVHVFVIALAFPLGYGLWDLVRRRKINAISILGLVSVLLTGGIGLLALDPKWIAIKEASIPLLIGIVVLGTLKTPYPLVRTFLYSPQVFDVPRIEAIVNERDRQRDLSRLLTRANILLAFSFFVSAVLNYVLAVIIVKTDPNVDMDAFNAEIGRMTALSWIVIVIPSMIVLGLALWYFVSGLTRITGLPFDELMHAEARAKAEASEKKAQARRAERERSSPDGDKAPTTPPSADDEGRRD